MAKGKKGYLVLHDELAPGEDFAAKTTPEFSGTEGKFIQHGMPESIVPANPDGPKGFPGGKGDGGSD